MPTVGYFSQFYWNGNRHTNIVITPLAPSKGGYPLRQAAVFGTFGVSVFGPPLDYLAVLWGRLRWSWMVLRLVWSVPASDRDWLVGWVRYLKTCDRQERFVHDQAQRLMTSTLWPIARKAVATTATTQGFTEPKFWKSISTKVHSDPGHAQQLFRHLHAAQAVKSQVEHVSSHDLNFIVEAAYHAFTQIPKKTV